MNITATRIANIGADAIDHLATCADDLAEVEFALLGDTTPSRLAELEARQRALLDGIAFWSGQAMTEGSSRAEVNDVVSARGANDYWTALALAEGDAQSV